MDVEEIEKRMQALVDDPSPVVDVWIKMIGVSAEDLGRVLAENARLREQVTALQQRGTELIQECRALQRKIDDYFGSGEAS